MTLYHSYRQPIEAPKKTVSREHERSARVRKLGRVGAIIAGVALCGTALASLIEIRQSEVFNRQSKVNDAVVQQVVAAIDTARAAALVNNASTYWTQSALGRDDKPYMEGSVWHVDLASDTAGMVTINRGSIDAMLGVNLHCPGAEIGFDSNGHLRNGAVELRIDSVDPGQAFLIDVGVDGSMTTKVVGS